MHLYRNQEGDEEKAYSLLNEALETNQKMDAKKRSARVAKKE
jgi:hypothetical protein